MHFRVAGSDFASHVVGVPLSKQLIAAGDELSVTISALNDNTVEDLSRGRLDLLLHVDDGHVPPKYERQALLQDDFVCVVDRSGPYGSKLTISEYLAARHVAVAIFGGVQTLPDQRLAASGLKRRVAFTVPQFTAAVQAVSGTHLIATVPRRIALLGERSANLKVLRAPKPMPRFTYFMWWHPRMNSDSAHIWLRNTVQKVSETL